MTNKDNTTLSPKTTQPEPPKPQKSRTLNPFSKLLIVFLSLFTWGLAVYAIFITLHLRQQFAQEGKKLETSTLHWKQQRREQSHQTHETLEALHSMQHKLQTQYNALEQRLNTIPTEDTHPKSDWALQKARYCLELAQINAHWSDDTQTTTALLQQADALLANQADQRLLRVRQAIAKEIAELQALPKVDFPGLLSQLDAAQSAVAHLPLKHLSKTLPSNTTPSPSSTNWHQSLQDSLNVLQQLVIIRHHEEALPLPPSKGYETILRERIQLNLQEAQWAVLQKEEAVYQLTLTQAIKAIQQSFDQTEPLMKQLEQLRTTHLPDKHPNFSEQSLPLLNDVIDSKNATSTAGEHK